MKKNHSRRDVMGGAVASAAAFALGSTRLPAATPVVHEVRISAFKFVPEVVEVAVGDTIRWTNEDLAPHTATADAFGWDTGELVRNAQAEITVTEGMETSYFCAFHPHMKGRLTIR